jgi:Zn-finger nucleic acid-binding protein
MEKKRFGRQPHGEVILDICWDCHGIWFDQYESSSLTPGAVIELFRLINEHRDKAARPLADAMACPQCRGKLAFTQDLQRTNRIVYHRCTNGHGRFTTFLQFLREKQFVRSLSPLEIDTLRATVKQVRCSGCGAPVDVARDAACGFCRSPLSILDPAAVEKALAGLGDAERRRAAPDKASIEAALDSLIATHRTPRREHRLMQDLTTVQTGPVLVDLVISGIGLLFDKGT